jgi:uncharacterized protein (TIGR03437 family)
MTTIGKLACASLLAAVSAGAAPTIRRGGVVNAASYVSPGLPNYGIARGSVFVVFGDDLGPEPLKQADFPLPSSAGLGGTSVQVTVGGVMVDAIMVYTSAQKLAAILPSRTPTGNGSVTVTYNGETSAPSPIQVLQNGFAVFTRNQSGSGPALAENYISDSEQSANTLDDSARPGQTILLYGTGLGPVSFDETGPPQPEDFDVNVEVYVGGKPARVLYKGRSSCCAGVDQIRFVVPESVQGCYVPVVVRTGDFIRNFATIAVEPDGKPCSDPNRLSLDDLQRIQNGESFRIGSISLGRSAIIGKADLNKDSGAASFVQYDASQWLGENLYGLYPGACTVFTFRFDAAGQFFDPLQAKQLDAGAVISINGPNGSKQLVKNNGSYSGILGGSQGAPDFLEAGTYVIDNGAGGADIGAFHTTVNIATPLVWTNVDNVSSRPRETGITVTWSGADPNDLVSITGISITREGGASFTCAERVSAGQFTVPPIVLSSLPVSETAANGPGSPAGNLTVSNSSNSKFTAPGLDAAYFTFSNSTSKTVAYR